ncbi:Arc family DNA-binding protein [Xenorhabdus sp. PB62.4]|uniref:Arc family DNA-binding protein n=1 Tax=Xenorhabdus sp. PB62.4 TaxID=1851573 RepID=UPI0016574039|nr:Arc family DNA-binding protein [Xenorhabdus sp. PB62.4]MBC8954541.1 Rha family transcriptional regulator [Xenorhabdus sp. PB62.4]
MSERKYKNPQVNLRLPVELRDKVTKLAEVNGRSSNQEMVAAIEAWVSKNEVNLDVSVTDVTNRVTVLEKEIGLTKNCLNKDLVAQLCGADWLT